MFHPDGEQGRLPVGQGIRTGIQWTEEVREQILLIEVSLLRVYTGGDRQAGVTALQSFLPAFTADCSNTLLLCRAVFLVFQPGLLTAPAI